MKLHGLLLTGTALAGLTLFTGGANAAAVCPAVGADTDCGIIITVTDTGTSTAATGQGPYDGIEDTLIGVVNNSSNPIFSLNLSGGNIFGFDGDGLQAYNGSLGSDPTGYGGKTSSGENTSFIVVNANNGTAVFGTGGIAPGGTAYFSLEESVRVSTIVVTPAPEPASLALLGAGLAGMGMLRRRRSA